MFQVVSPGDPPPKRRSFLVLKGAVNYRLNPPLLLSDSRGNVYRRKSSRPKRSREPVNLLRVSKKEAVRQLRALRRRLRRLRR